MAQTTILASAQTAATSSDVTVAAGANATVGIFATGQIPTGVQVGIYEGTPGSDNLVDTLDFDQPAKVIAGPGTFRLKRGVISQYGVNVGCYADV